MKIYLYLLMAWSAVCFCLIVSGCNNVLMHFSREKWEPEDKKAWEELWEKANRGPSKPMTALAILLLAVVIIGYISFVRFTP